MAACLTKGLSKIKHIKAATPKKIVYFEPNCKKIGIKNTPKRIKKAIAFIRSLSLSSSFIYYNLAF